MKIVYLYSEVMGYTLAVVQALVEKHNAEVHIVYWDHKKKVNYTLPVLKGVFYYKRSLLNKDTLENLIQEINPSLLYISGRMDKDYLKCALFAKSKGIVTVAGIDAQWTPSLKNYLISLLAPLWYKKYFNYVWVPGELQCEFAKKLGYNKQHIIPNLLSADVYFFGKRNTDVVAKQFVYVGRLANEKGIDILCSAFLKSLEAYSHDWVLKIIGNGPLEYIIPSHSSIQVENFMQPQALIEELTQGGVFVLPSRDEPWGVVLHEFAAAGFPILCSNVCGAASTFVKDGYNGYVFQSGSVEQLMSKMKLIIDLSEVDLMTMSRRSRVLSKIISPEISAQSLISVLN